MQSIDILVIGGGPAGTSAALEAARGGATVLLAEKRFEFSGAARCAEYIPRMLARELPIPRDLVVQQITAMKTFYPGGETVLTKAPGYILDRMRFDRYLVDLAGEAGVEVWLGSPVTGRSDEVVHIRRRGSTEKIRPRIIIGADGPKSMVAQWIGTKPQRFLVGLQYRVRLTKPLEETEIYFAREWFGGYGWLFPRGNEANVGIGVRIVPGRSDRIDLCSLLNRFAGFLASSGKIEGTPTARVAGLIPAFGPDITVKDNILLAGDAAGQTHPITGGGIPQAVLCGRAAGKIAAQAIRHNRMDHLPQYDRLWRWRWETELGRGAACRRYMEDNWQTFEDTISRCWIASPEYYERFHR